MAEGGKPKKISPVTDINYMIDTSTDSPHASNFPDAALAIISTSKGETMFPEYRDLITRLKSEGNNHRFLHLFEKHNELDHQIKALESHDAGGTHRDRDAEKRKAAD